MNETLQRRARQIRSRTAIRAWEFRQRRHASGVWFRLRRALADASEAYEIGRADADRLIAEGYAPEPVGAELEPSKTLLFLPAERIAALDAATLIPLTLGPRLLGARFIALVRFPR